MDMKQLAFSLKGISTYKNIMQEKLMVEALALVTALTNHETDKALDSYTNIFYQLREEGYLGIGTWLFDKLCYTPSHFAKMIEQGTEDPALENCAMRDIETLILLARTDCDTFIQEIAKGFEVEYHPTLNNLPRWQGLVDYDFHTIEEFYKTKGYGIFAKYRGFLWNEKGLVPVTELDSPKPSELLGYSLQRDQVIENTRVLMSGKPAQNVLLFGDAGTGKSASVKSLLSFEGMEWLRIIQVDKSHVGTLPTLMPSLARKKLKFIIFIDDLAFDQDDNTYSLLKTVLEGGLQRRPENVVIYATSNRRHLIRQTVSERAGDEMDTAETISEKTALAERFGLRIPYLTMSKEEYLALVSHFDQGKSGLSTHNLHVKAMMWEIRHGGRTPRVAKQFILSLLNGTEEEEDN
ncbi:MAG: DUF815 domain-containing protein [Eubacteriales bacterium]